MPAKTLLDIFIEEGLVDKVLKKAVSRSSKELHESWKTSSSRRQIGRDDIIRVNKQAIESGPTLKSYDTPIYKVAQGAGFDKIDLSTQPDVWALRYGSAPESGISQNYADDISERGLSVFKVFGDNEFVPNNTGLRYEYFFGDRPVYGYKGMLLPYRGSDGEPLILPYHFNDWDDFGF